MNGVPSNLLAVISGGQQGTVLGPLLFLILINDPPENISSSVKFFADDCLIYRTIHSPNNAIQLQDLDQQGLWVNVWQRNLRLHRCPVMCVSNKQSTLSTKYTINGIAINCALTVKYLGASISSKMSWSDHIGNICANAK